MHLSLKNSIYFWLNDFDYNSYLEYFDGFIIVVISWLLFFTPIIVRVPRSIKNKKAILFIFIKLILVTALFLVLNSYYVFLIFLGTLSVELWCNNSYEKDNLISNHMVRIELTTLLAFTLFILSLDIQLKYLILLAILGPRIFAYFNLYIRRKGMKSEITYWSMVVSFAIAYLLK